MLVCVECGRASDDEAVGWRAYREDLPGGDDPPSVAIFCPICAAYEFDPELPGERVYASADDGSAETASS